MDSEKKIHFEKAKKWLTKTGVEDFKANMDGYEQPSSFTNSKTNETIYPDIEFTYRNEMKHFVEIAVKKDSLRADITKWKLLSFIAKRKGGKLHLLIPRGHKATIVESIKNAELDAVLSNI